MAISADIHFENGTFLVSGVLDFTTVVPLWQRSLSVFAAHQELSLDLFQVTVSNSAGLALLIEWMKYAKLQQKPIRFSHLPAQLQSIARAAGVAEMIASSSI